MSNPCEALVGLRFTLPEGRTPSTLGDTYKILSCEGDQLQIARMLMDLGPTRARKEDPWSYSIDVHSFEAMYQLLGLESRFGDEECPNCHDSSVDPDDYQCKWCRYNQWRGYGP